RAGHRHEVFMEDIAVRLEPGGVQVGHVVGDDIELPLQRHLPRKADQETVLHRSCSPSCRRRRVSPRGTSETTANLFPSPRSRGALQMPCQQQCACELNYLVKKSPAGGRAICAALTENPAKFSHRETLGKAFINHAGPSLPPKA